VHEEEDMGYTAKVIRVFIASPSDVQNERQITREAIYQWNSINSLNTKLVLVPVGWEKDTTASYGSPPQEEINAKLLATCDLLVGIFWRKLGSETKEFISGSVEEIEKHTSSGKPAMLFFSNAAIPKKEIDEDQYQKLEKFKESIKHKCLYMEYKDYDEFASLIFDQLSRQMNEEWVKSELHTLIEPVNKSREILSTLMTEWSLNLDIQHMSEWTTCLTYGTPYLPKEMYDRLDQLTRWILSRTWGTNQEAYIDGLYRFRLILSDLLLFYMKYSEYDGSKGYIIVKKYNNPNLKESDVNRFVMEYEFVCYLVIDLVAELCRATNYLLDLFRTEIDPMFLLNIGHIYITTGPHMDGKDLYYVVLYKERDRIPYENLDKFKTDRKNRDVCFGIGVGIDDPEFLEWYHKS